MNGDAVGGLDAHGALTHNRRMTAAELDQWLRSLQSVPEPSVDRIVAGRADVTVRGIAAVWMPSWAALREAERRGLNVIVAHEPTFYAHLDYDGFEQAFAPLPPKARAEVTRTRDEKRAWIDEHEMAVIRCHDVLDLMPGGVVDSLANALGFSAAECRLAEPYHRVIALKEPMQAGEVARRLATRFAELGAPGVGFCGEAARVVHTLGLGTGYACDPWRFVELGAEMAVTIHDRVKTWTELSWANDAGYPLVVIDHGTSEEWGVRTLAKIIAARWPELPVHLLPQGLSYAWVPAIS